MRCKLIALCLLVGMLLSAPTVQAVKGSTSVSRGSTSRGTSGTGKTISSGSYRKASPTPSGSSFYRRPSTPRRAGERSALIPQNGPQPSSGLTRIIHEQESSGPGWLGTAFLISMLSRHDISGDDRRWIQDRIDALKEEGEDDTPERLSAVKPPVIFSFSGLEAPLQAGKKAHVEVWARKDGQPVEVSCEHPAAHIQGDHVQIQWTPGAVPETFMLSCTAQGRRERRIVRVTAAPLATHQP